MCALEDSDLTQRAYLLLLQGPVWIRLRAAARFGEIQPDRYTVRLGRLASTRLLAAPAAPAAAWTIRGRDGVEETRTQVWPVDDWRVSC